MITLMLATAALTNPMDIEIENDFLNFETGAFLSQPDVYIDDDWFMMDIAAAPEGRVVMTLEQSCDPLLCSAGSQRISARVDGQIVETLEFKVTETSAIAIDHLEGDGTGKDSVDVFVMVADQNLIFPILWVPQFGLLQALQPEVAPGPITQPLDIAAGNDGIFLTGMDHNDVLHVMALVNGNWTSTPSLDPNPLKWDERPPAIDLDRTRNRLTLGQNGHLTHLTPDLQVVGECVLVNDSVEPHLGKEFAVEDGVLIYVNYTIHVGGDAPSEHRMHIADADDCKSLDVLDSIQTYTMNFNTKALNAMSIEPLPMSEWWPISQNPEPEVRSWTTISIGAGVPVDEHWVGTGTGIFSVDGFMERRPF